MEAIFAVVRKIGGLNLDKSGLHLVCSYGGIFGLETGTLPRREAGEGGILGRGGVWEFFRGRDLGLFAGCVYGVSE